MPRLAIAWLRNYYIPVNDVQAYLAMDDAALLAQCDVHVYKASGPGGQHRNKVSSAVRVRHRATQITAHGDETRSQHENKRLAIRRLRMNIALQLRRPISRETSELPPVVAECIFRPRKAGPDARQRLQVGRKDRRFWATAAFLLDVLEAFEGGLADAAAYVGITTSNFISTLKSDRHLYAAAQTLRKRHGRRPIT